MRLTRRGWALVALVVVGVFMAWHSGARSLNALVVPLALALAAGFVTVARAGEPPVTRSPIEEGKVGDVRPVEFEFDVDSPTLATVADPVDDGLAADGNVAATTLTDDGHCYELELRERGDYEVGPVAVTVTDALGLVAHRYTDDAIDRVLVYPRIHPLRGDTGDALRALADAAPGHDRDEFDHLRTYERGDSLRDVHWKSAARRTDDTLMVKAYTADGGSRRVELVAESIPGRADEMAAAAASVAGDLLERGVAVDVTVPDGSRARASTSRDGFRDLLELLARAGPGKRPAADQRAADVVISAEADGTIVRVDGRTIPFDRLRADRGSAPARRDRDGRRSGVVA